MPAPMGMGSFPTTLKGESVTFYCRSQKYVGIVAKAERDDECSFATVLLTFAERLPDRPFALGELALLEASEESWTGTVAKSKAWTKEISEAPLRIPVFVSVPDGGDCSGFSYDDLLTIYPAKPQQSRLSFAMNKPSNGLIGFGALGMHLIQALLDNEYIDLVAISIDSPPSDMLRTWKNGSISLRIKDPRTILFKRLNMNADEVVVTVVRDRVYWDGLSVDYVVDSVNILTDEKHVIHSMAYKGKDKAKAYSMVNDDNGIASQLPKVTAKMQVKLKYMKLVVISADAFEPVVSNVSEWDQEDSSARICFLADDNPTERICNPFTEQSDKNIVDAGHHVSVLLRIFIDVIRRVPISGCCLNL